MTARKIKRTMTFFGAAAIFLLLGCQGKTGPGSLASGASRAPRGILPLFDGNVTFTAFIGGVGSATTSFSYNENAFTKRVVDDTGIKLSIQGVTNSERSEKLNILLNSGSYPDLIFYDAISLNDMYYYVSQEIFVPLDQYEPLSYPNIAKAFEEYPALNERLRGSDGKLYGLPAVNDCLHCTFRAGRAFYYMPFIRDHKLKVPKTLDEFRTYLRYIRDNDVNGNGDPHDEIPVAFEKVSLKNVVAMIAKAYMPFIYSDQYYGLALYDKKVTEQYRLEEFREALRYLNSLFREGLILEDSFTMTRDQLQTLGENPGAPVLGVALVEMSNHPVIQGSERWFDFFLLPVLQGPSGQQNGPNKDPWSILSPGMFVTDKCSRPDLAVALYDYFLNPEIMLTGNIGQKGVAWDDPDSGALSILGTPALYKSLGSGKLLNATWDQQNPMIRSNSFRLGTQANDVETALSFIKTGDPALKARLLKNPSYNEVANYHMAMTHVPYGIPAKYFIPPLVLNDDDNTRIADINAVLNSYKEQTMVEFITGKRSLDEGWASYLAELNHLGSGELAAIIQKYIK